MRTFFPLLLGFATLSLSGCGRDSAEPAQGSGSDRIHVVATISPLADWAQQVGGKHVETTVLLPPGASPHVFEPSASDMKRVAGASLFLRVGLQMDDWAGRLAQAAGKQVRDVAVGDLLARRDLLPDVEAVTSSAEVIHAEGPHDHDHEHGAVNPHFWLDPVLAAGAVEEIGRALSQADPAHAAEYAANASRYIEQLHALDKDLQSRLQPMKGRSFVSFHNAYPYLAHRYGLGIAAVIEESPGKTPSERYVRRVADRLRHLGVKTVFAEPQLNPRVAEVLAREVGGRVDLLDPYGSRETPDRDTYVELMQYNAGKLAEALSEGK